MEEDRVNDEFASFKRRLESRPGKDDERNDAVKEGEAKSDTSEASDSSSEGVGEVCVDVFAGQERDEMLFPCSSPSTSGRVWRATTSTEPGTEPQTSVWTARSDSD